ncbi:D-glycero-beta-D-manno-heptose 1,7-bisphosphate 7-phosphatase [Ampullimonas aquatilis]|uniref:D-glycero-beta-D-manno-heptose 1,7-bisphosphate 7-phosphatase n=1 Tax=Ampullimonas aquatilis TaxID=1341549 RepID=UPI003C775206
MKKLVVFDRDGVINHDNPNYIRSPEDWHPIDGAAEAIAKISASNISIAIATNQAGIAKNCFSMRTLEQIHQKMISHVRSFGGNIDRIYFCPHQPSDHCDCRKPNPKMLLQACSDFNVETSTTYFIGDSLRDTQAAVSAGCKPALVLTGNGKVTSMHPDLPKEIEIYSSLLDFAVMLSST